MEPLRPRGRTFLPDVRPASDLRTDFDPRGMDRALFFARPFASLPLGPGFQATIHDRGTMACIGHDRAIPGDPILAVSNPVFFFVYIDWLAAGRSGLTVFVGTLFHVFLFEDHIF